MNHDDAKKSQDMMSGRAHLDLVRSRYHAQLVRSEMEGKRRKDGERLGAFETKLSKLQQQIEQYCIKKEEALSNSPQVATKNGGSIAWKVLSGHCTDLQELMRNVSQCGMDRLTGVDRVSMYVVDRAAGTCWSSFPAEVTKPLAEGVLGFVAHSGQKIHSSTSLFVPVKNGEIVNAILEVEKASAHQGESRASPEFPADEMTWLEDLATIVSMAVPGLLSGHDLQKKLESANGRCKEQDANIQALGTEAEALQTKICELQMELTESKEIQNDLEQKLDQESRSRGDAQRETQKLDHSLQESLCLLKATAKLVPTSNEDRALVLHDAINEIMPINGFTLAYFDEAKNETWYWGNSVDHIRVVLDRKGAPHLCGSMGRTTFSSDGATCRTLEDGQCRQMCIPVPTSNHDASSVTAVLILHDKLDGTMFNEYDQSLGEYFANQFVSTYLDCCDALVKGERAQGELMEHKEKVNTFEDIQTSLEQEVRQLKREIEQLRDQNLVLAENHEVLQRDHKEMQQRFQLVEQERDGLWSDHQKSLKELEDFKEAVALLRKTEGILSPTNGKTLATKKKNKYLQNENIELEQKLATIFNSSSANVSFHDDEGSLSPSFVSEEEKDPGMKHIAAKTKGCTIRLRRDSDVPFRPAEQLALNHLVAPILAWASSPRQTATTEERLARKQQHHHHSPRKKVKKQIFFPPSDSEEEGEGESEGEGEVVSPSSMRHFAEEQHLSMHDVARSILVAGAEGGYGTVVNAVNEQVKTLVNHACETYICIHGNSEDREMLVVPASTLASEKVPVGRDTGIEGVVLKNGDSIKVNDASKDSRVNTSLLKQLHTEKPEQIMACATRNPLDGSISGVLVVLSHQIDQPFTEADVDCLERISASFLGPLIHIIASKENVLLEKAAVLEENHNILAQNSKLVAQNEALLVQLEHNKFHAKNDIEKQDLIEQLETERVHIAKLVQELRFHQEDFERIFGHCKLLMGECATALKAKEAKEEDLRLAKRTILEMQSKIDFLETKVKLHKEAESEKRLAQKMCVAARDACKHAEEEMATLQSKLDQALQEMNELNTELEAQKSEAISYKRELDVSKQTISFLEQHQNEMKDDLENMRKDCEQLKKDRDEIVLNKNHVEIQVALLQKEMKKKEDMEETMSRLDQRLQLALTENVQVKEKSRAMKQRVNALNKTQEKLAKELEDAILQKQRRELENQQLRFKQKIMGNEYESVQCKLREMEKTVTQIQNDNLLRQAESHETKDKEKNQINITREGNKFQLTLSNNDAQINLSDARTAIKRTKKTTKLGKSMSSATRMRKTMFS